MCHNYEPPGRGRQLVSCGVSTASESSAAVCTYRCKCGERGLLFTRTKCQHVTACQQHVSAVLIFEQAQRHRSTPKLNPVLLTFRHRASCILGQALHYSPENAFYIFIQRTLFIYLINKYISLSDICLTVHHWYK